MTSEPPSELPTVHNVAISHIPLHKGDMLDLFNASLIFLVA